MTINAFFFNQVIVFNFIQYNTNFSTSESEYDMPLTSLLIDNLSLSLSYFSL